MGYVKAGFDVVGVDNRRQPRYPFTFYQGDALCYLRQLWEAGKGGNPRSTYQPFDVIHASPPCQRYTCLKSVFDSTKYADLVASTRDALDRLGVPYVIENVVGAPLRRDLMLCAATFGLRSYRHRIFESNVALIQPEHYPHVVSVNRRGQNRRDHWNAGGFVTVTGDIGSYVGPKALGIDWMTGAELSQAIPPAYAEYVGRQLLSYLGRLR